MTLLNTANKLYLGAALASKAYLGAAQVWPPLAGFDAATTAWAAAVVTAGGTVSGARKTLVDQLIVGLKADGVWAKLDRLWIFAAENSQSALVDLVALTQATPVSSPTFTADRGYAGNGSSSYINSNFNAFTSGVNWTLNSAHMSGWSNTERANSPIVLTGVYNGAVVSDLMPLYGGGMVGRLNGGGLAGLNNTTSVGFFVGQRNNSSTTECIRNGVSCGTTGDAASSIASLPFFICGRNDSGGFSSAMADQLSMVSYGASFTATENTNYYNRLRTYMTAVGVP